MSSSSSSLDPLSYITSPPSTVVVKVINTSREDVNGQLGIVTSYSQDRGRYVVHLVASQTTMALKPENTTRANTFQQYQAHFQQFKNDPRIRQSLLRFEAQYLPAGFSLKTAGMSLGVLVLALVLFWGFTKTLTLVSLLLLLGSIAAPDLLLVNRGVDGRSVLAACARNFPTRCRETLELTVPAARGRVSNRMAFGLVLVLVLWIGRALVTSSSPKARVKPPTTTTTQATRDVGGLDKKEFYYNLGYEDATAGKPHGTSLSEEPPAVTTTRSLDEDLLNYDYVPPPSQKNKSRFGFSTAMSCFFLYRTINELGTNGHQQPFNIQVAIANLKTMEPWKMGILGFSVFNLIRSFV